MMFKRPEYNIYKCATFEELADKLLNYGWTLCSGFEYDGYFFLNDATSEDGAQEYAVVKDGYQIDSWTCSWMNQESFRMCFDELQESDMRNKVTFKISTDGTHECGYCA